MTCRSFENNWNTYKLLAHINPPDVKVKIFVYLCISFYTFFCQT